MRRYADRAEAGRELARHLAHLAGREDVLVLGLARGGVPVAAEVASALGAELDVLVVRKLGLPHQPELAMGAVAGVGGSLEVVRHEPVLARSRTPEDVVERVRRREEAVLAEREAAYRAGRGAVVVRGRPVVLVDDGLATGATARAAVAAVRRLGPALLVVAAPTGSHQAVAALAQDVDEVVCPSTPARFRAVAQDYGAFPQTSDDEVRRALAAAPPTG